MTAVHDPPRALPASLAPPLEAAATLRTELRRSRAAVCALGFRVDDAYFAAHWAADTALRANQAAHAATERGVRALIEGTAKAQAARVGRVLAKTRALSRELLPGREDPAAPAPILASPPGQAEARPPASANSRGYDWPVPPVVERRWGQTVPWGEPMVTAILEEGRLGPNFVEAILGALGGQTLGSLELVVVDATGKMARRVNAVGEVLEAWSLEGAHTLARTVLGKFVCLMEASFLHLPSNYLELNVLALEGHDAEFAVNGFGPRPMCEGAVAEHRLPDTSPGSPSRPLVVFRAEYLSAKLSFDLTKLATEGRQQARAVGRLISHDAVAGAPWEAPLEWSTRLEIPRYTTGYLDGDVLLRPATSDPTVRMRLLDLQDALQPTQAVSSGRPKVLVCFPFLAIGGAEKLTLDVLERLSGRFEFLILTVERPDASVGSTHDAYRRIAPKFFVAPDFLDSRLTTSLAAYLIRLYGVQTMFVPNGSSWFYDMLPALKARCPALRIVNQVFDHNYGWINRYSPEVGELVDAHAAPNKSIVAAYAKQGVPKHKVHLIHHGIDLAAFDPAAYDGARRQAARRRLGLPEGKKVVSFVARIHPQKRPMDFLRVADSFRDDPTCTFLMVGDGPAAVEVAAMAAKLRLPNLRCLPFYQPIQDVLATTDVLVIPSEYEGLPLVLLNALAMGVPVVATDVGSISEILTAEFGVIVRKPGDVRGLTAGVKKLLQLPNVQEVRQRARAAVAAGYDIARATEQYARAIVGGEA